MKKLLITILACLICLQAFVPCLAFEELSKGSKGDAVIELQNRLNELGYSVGKADGDFGEKTEKAIQQFQRESGIEVTGICNEKTYNALFALSLNPTNQGDVTTNDEEESSNASVFYGIDDMIHKDDIADMSFSPSGSNAIRVLTNSGQVWEILGWDDTHAKELTAMNVKQIGETVFIYKDNRIGIDPNYAYSYKYELDDEWHDLSLYAVGRNHAVGLKENGEWITKGNWSNGQRDVDEWEGIVAIDVGYDHTIGLKEDETVIATGLNDEGQCNVSDWSDIIEIYAEGNTTYGLKSDGTVVATGNNRYGQCNVTDWSSISQILPSIDCVVGLKNDGTVVIAGPIENYFSQIDIEDWADLIRVEGGFSGLCGLTADGRFLTTDRGFKYDDEYIKIPEDYRFINEKKIILSPSRILVIHEDNTIEYFGKDKEYWITLMDYINKGIALPPNMIYYNRMIEQVTENTEETCINIALEYMKSHLSQYLKNPSSLQINGTSCISSDGTTYWIIIDYSAMNSFGGYERNNYYCQVDYSTGKVLTGGIM